MSLRLRKIFFTAKEKIISHYLAVLVAVIVGLIYIAPNLIFILSLGDEYKGIPMMRTGNEDFYLARIREIIDGHPALGSFVFYEYKNQPPLSPPAGEFLYALPTLLFGISPINTLIASRFFLSLILFLLIYFLVRALTSSLESLSNKINSVACALFVVLGYDLVDYRSIWRFFTGQLELSSGGFLIWSRPVNPILGAIFLFSFLIFIWKVVQKNPHKKINIIGAAAFFSLMIGNYFFSWGLALSVLGILVLIYLFKREFLVVRNLLWVVFGTALLSAPYWYSAWTASKSPWYGDSVLRSGLFYTHYPLLNKLMLAVLAFYLLAAVLIPSWVNRLSFGGLKRSLIATIKNFQNWQWFCLAFIFGSLGIQSADNYGQNDLALSFCAIYYSAGHGCFVGFAVQFRKADF